MNLDTVTFFVVVLQGSGLVWSFRKGSGSIKQISEFEYLCFSAFWGIMLLAAAFSGASDKTEYINRISENIYVAGAGAFLVALVFGFLAGKIKKYLRLFL